MRFALKAVLCLLVLGIVGLVGYAVFSDLPAPRSRVEVPVEAK